jgi:opacity protein-like surface antigen
MRGRVLVFATVCLAAANTCLAQQRQPIARFVVDVKGASAGLPTEEGWTPVVPAGTVAPSRSLGLEAGAHVQVLRFRVGSVGMGATWLRARGTTSGPEIPAGTPAPMPPIPDLTTRLSSVAPQLSLNFGHALGWSYLSAGLGATKVESEASSTSSTIRFTPRNSEWVKTVNFGGGARWFLTDHLGVGFDLRWHQLSPIAATLTSPGAPRASLITAGVGVALK